MIRLWRFLMLVAIGVGVIFAFYDAIVTPPVASGSVYFGTPPTRGFLRGPLHWKLAKDPSKKSMAYAAGMRKGDLVYLKSRYVDYRTVEPGDTIAFSVVHPDGTTQDVSLTAKALKPKPKTAEDYLIAGGKLLTKLLMFAVAILLIMQRADSVSARALATFLVSFGASLLFTLELFNDQAHIAAHFTVNYLIVVSLVMVMRFAASFPDPGRRDLDVRGIRRFIFLTAPIFGFVMAADVTLWVGSQYLYGTNEPIYDTIWWTCWGYGLVATVIALFVGLSCATGNDRQRLIYITPTFFVGFLGPIMTVVAIALHIDYATAAEYRLTSIVIPLGFGYAMLRVRVLDTGFVMNRALVYGTFSAAVAFVFLGLQWINNKFLVPVDATLGVVGNVLIAVFLGFSMRVVHGKIDEIVDSMFFRQKRNAKMAIRNFSHQVQFVTEMEMLLHHTIDIVDKHAGSQGSAIYITERGKGFYETGATSFEMAPKRITENDLAILQMRATAQPVDLVGLESGLFGVMAFPMMVRGFLVGFLVVGEKAHDEQYAPDEVEALQALAQQTGVAIDVRIANSEREAAQKNLLEEQEKSLAEMQRVNKAFSRFVPAKFLEYLGKASILDVELGDQTQREMTVLFSDIRSFTSLSEKMTPQENFNFLNSYLKRMGPIIRQHHGLIDKYIGDAVMGLFPESADDAVAAGVDMHRDLLIYNRHRAKLGYDAIRIGVGLHTGTLMLGTIGESERMESTVISDAVNLASRLESLTKHYKTGMLISEETRNHLKAPEAYSMRFLGNIAVVGKLQGVGIYEVYEVDPPELLLHKEATADTFQRAMVLYQEGVFDEAGALFAQLVGMNMSDGPANYFLGRCRTLAKEMASTGSDWRWDGIDRLEVK